jgi:exonuclease III
MDYRFVKSSSKRSTRLAVLLAGVLSVTALGASPSLARPSAVPNAPTDVTISSFNALGSSHTLHSAKYATGVSRAKGVVRLLDRHSVDVVGFQEMQADQLGRFLDLEGGAYAAFPGVGNRSVDGENSVAWRTSTWELTESSTVSIPYFNGRARQMPVVKLRNKATGVSAWFANFHNPATNKRHRHQDRWRARAIAAEVVLANKLRRTGLPVFFTGDMNERAKVFCPMTGDAPMQAARGGTNRNGVCDAERPWYVDWIFGTKRLKFTDYVEDLSPLVRRTTDHPVIVSTAHIDPVKFPKAVTPTS